MAEKSHISAPSVLIPLDTSPILQDTPQPLCPSKQVAGREDHEVSGQVSHERVCIPGTDGDPDGQVHRCVTQTTGKGEIRNRVQPVGRGKAVGMDGQDSYQGSREPAGQAGRREGLRHSYSPWRSSEPCRSRTDRTAGEKGVSQRGAAGLTLS